MHYRGSMQHSVFSIQKGRRRSRRAAGYWIIAIIEIGIAIAIEKPFLCVLGVLARVLPDVQKSGGARNTACRAHSKTLPPGQGHHRRHHSLSKSRGISALRSVRCFAAICLVHNVLLFSPNSLNSANSNSVHSVIPVTPSLIPALRAECARQAVFRATPLSAAGNATSAVEPF